MLFQTKYLYNISFVLGLKQQIHLECYYCESENESTSYETEDVDQHFYTVVFSSILCCRINVTVL